MRPVLVIQSEVLNHSSYANTIVLPLTTQLIDDAEPLRFRVAKREELTQDSDVLIGHIRSIDNNRFTEKLAKVSAEEMRKILLLLYEILD